jgi:hypothetical protein
LLELLLPLVELVLLIVNFRPCCCCGLFILSFLGMISIPESLWPLDESRSMTEVNFLLLLLLLLLLLPPLPLELLLEEYCPDLDFLLLLLLVGL